MDDDRADRYQRLLARQLAMNGDAWGVLQSHGVVESAELRLEFSFSAPAEANARALEALLRDATDYAVAAQSDGGPFRRRWSVVGATQRTTVSLATLDQWVDWMVTAGLAQDCEFDGWGTEI